MELKLGRRIFNVTNKDLILDNGKVFILITQKYFADLVYQNPTVSKTTFRKLLKEGKIKLSNKKYVSTICEERYDLYEFVIEDNE